MTSSAGDQDARSTDEGGHATAPPNFEDVTFELATDGTVCITCPTQTIWSRSQNKERGVARGCGVRTTDNQPPSIKDKGHPGPNTNTQDIQSNMAMDTKAHRVTTAVDRSPSNDGWERCRPAFGDIQGRSDEGQVRPDVRGVTVRFRETVLNTTTTIGEAAENQPPSDNSWGRARPAFADLQSGGDANNMDCCPSHFRGKQLTSEGRGGAEQT